MRKLLRLSWALLGAVSLSGGCSSNHVVVEAKSPSLDTFQGSIGHVNTPAYAVGDVLAYDSATHKLWKAASVQVDAMDLCISPELQETSEPVKDDLQLGYSRKLPAGVKNEVSAQVKGQTVLHVHDYFSRGLKSPDLFVAGSGQLADQLASVHAKSPDARFFLVSSVTSASKVYLSCDDVEHKLEHVGKRDFEVKYGQNEQLAELAKRHTAFFKLTALKLAEGGQKPCVMVDKESAETLPEHQIRQVLAATTWE